MHRCCHSFSKGRWSGDFELMTRDIGTVCQDAVQTLASYIREDQSNLSLASLIGQRLMSVQNFATNFVSYTTKSCYELLFLHEVVLERLLCTESCRQKLGMEAVKDAMTIKQQTNITLKRILAAYKDLGEDDINEEVLMSSKVGSSFAKLTEIEGSKRVYDV